LAGPDQAETPESLSRADRKSTAGTDAASTAGRNPQRGRAV